MAWIAKVYFAEFADMDRNATPLRRLCAELGEINADVALEGLVGQIVDAQAKRRLAEQILAGLGAGPEALVAIGDGANDVPLITLAGLGVGYRPKPALAEVADGLIRHHDLAALLWMQGIPRSAWSI